VRGRSFLLPRSVVPWAASSHVASQVISIMGWLGHIQKGAAFNEMTNRALCAGWVVRLMGVLCIHSAMLAGLLG
jgi:hypothetical protein